MKNTCRPDAADHIIRCINEGDCFVRVTVGFIRFRRDAFPWDQTIKVVRIGIPPYDSTTQRFEPEDVEEAVRAFMRMIYIGDC